MWQKFGDLNLDHSTIQWTDTTEVNESYFTSGEQLVQQNDRYVNDSTLTVAVRRRVATLVGNPVIANDDLVIAGILGITVIVRTDKENRSKAELERGVRELQQKGVRELQQKYGRRMPGAI
jgi:hypothetical protein